MAVVLVAQSYKDSIYTNTSYQKFVFHMGYSQLEIPTFKTFLSL